MMKEGQKLKAYSVTSKAAQVTERDLVPKYTPVYACTYAHTHSFWFVCMLFCFGELLDVQLCTTKSAKSLFSNSNGSQCIE